MRPVTTKFTVGVGRCRNCGWRVQARHAEQTSDALGAASSQVGPTAKAWAAWLHYGLGLSFVKSASLLARLGVNVSAGALCQAAQSTSTDLVPVQASIVAAVNNSAMIVPDETGWRVGGKGTWLWVAATRGATAYWVADGRGFEQACAVAVCDEGVVVVGGEQGQLAARGGFDPSHDESHLGVLVREGSGFAASASASAYDEAMGKVRKRIPVAPTRATDGAAEGGVDRVGSELLRPGLEPVTARGTSPPVHVRTPMCLEAYDNFAPGAEFIQQLNAQLDDIRELKAERRGRSDEVARHDRVGEPSSVTFAGWSSSRHTTTA
jgi:hypothetical protein